MWLPPPHGVVVGRLSVETDLSRHALFAPTSLAPDASFGVTDRVGIAVLTSRASELAIGAGSGVCIQGAHETLGMSPPACEERLADLEAAGQVRLTRRVFGSVGVAMHTWSTYALDVAVGTDLRRGRWWTIAVPALVVGMIGRDEGNRDRARLAVYGGCDLGDGEVHVRTGVDGALATFAETFVVPVGLGGSVVLRDVRVGADITLERALGPLNGRAWRSAMVYAELRMGGGAR
jgi:hypothetical protein